MPWVESIIQEVWTSKGALKMNERVELSDEEAAFLVEREQVIEVDDGEPAPEPKKKGKAKKEGDDPEEEEE